MAQIPKSRLFRAIEDAIRGSGWNVLHLSGPKEHPTRYQIYRNGRSHLVRAYIWNLTHGGGAVRPSHEYRIQITGISGPAGAQQFQPEIGGKTLILGWRDEIGVFAGFDYQHHTQPLGSSPSIQIGEAALLKAAMTGFAPYNKGSGEIAIAFRPDFLATYIENLEALHGCGASAGEVAILDEIGDDPAEVGDTGVEEGVAAERRYAVVAAKRALRSINFRDRVLTAYGQRCAMCGIQLNLLDAAHILPAAHPHSTDQTRNGVALCTLHHRAYDKAFVTFDPDSRIHLNEEIIGALKAQGRDGGIDRFRRQLRPVLCLPPDKRDWPDPALVTAANGMRGWAL